jgi:hypothetical protein
MSADTVSSGKTFFNVDLPSGTGAGGSPTGDDRMASAGEQMITIPGSNARVGQDGGSVTQHGQLTMPLGPDDAGVYDSGAGHGRGDHYPHPGAATGGA